MVMNAPVPSSGPWVIVFVTARDTHAECSPSKLRMRSPTWTASMALCDPSAMVMSVPAPKQLHAPRHSHRPARHVSGEVHKPQLKVPPHPLEGAPQL